MSTIYQALSNVQADLKAPKNNKNSFGNYNYRSAEDILEAVKPLLAREMLTMTLSDKVIQVGDKNYIEATVTVFDVSKADEPISVTAYAREAVDKKGMDDAQITGAASSYARKYALNGMFNIDDTKDADTDEHTKQRQKVERTVNTDLSKSGADQEEAVRVKKAKEDINRDLESLNYITDDAKKAFVKNVLGKEKIETLNDAYSVGDAIDNEINEAGQPYDYHSDEGAKG